MSINHEARIRTLETARVAADGQSESIGTKLAALQEKVAALDARMLTAETENERLRAALATPAPEATTAGGTAGGGQRRK